MTPPEDPISGLGPTLARITSGFAVPFLLIGATLAANGILLFGSMLIVPSAGWLFGRTAWRNRRKQSAPRIPSGDVSGVQ